LKKEDEEKTAFITPYDVFCYQVMPFGLKNAGATYQQMMQKLPQKSDRTQHSSLHQRRGHHHKKRRILDQWFDRNLRQPKQVQAQA
jgi:hypothetical protein